jgi:nitrogenase subunit NifH
VGYKDSLCVEIGELTKEMCSPWFTSQLTPLISSHNPNYVIHDLWHQDERPFMLPPVLQGIPRLLAVSSGEMSSVQVLNELFQWLNDINSSDCRFFGVIVNSTKNRVYELIVNDFVSRTGTSVIGSFPHSLMVSLSDYLGQTLLEAAPYSHNSILYRRLAQQIINVDIVSRPTFFDDTELEHWSRKWCEVIARMESGVVMDGSGI